MALYKKMHGGFWRLEKEGLRAIWKNAAGGSHQYSAQELDNIDLYESDTVDPFEEGQEERFILDNVLSRNLDFGWIDPKGRFYSCQPHCHMELLEDALGKNWARAEEKGWVKLAADRWYSASFFKDPTVAQRKMLEKVGRFTGDQHYIDRSLTYDGVFPQGYKPIDRLFEKFEKVVAAVDSRLLPVADPKTAIRNFMNPPKTGL